MKTTLDIPTRLVKETISGQPYYYKGYQQVLSGEKTMEEIMGSSDLQATMVFIITLYLGQQIDRKTFQIVSREAGLHLANRQNLANDLAIYRRTDLPADRNRRQYFSVAPLVAIEVDIDVEAGEPARDDFSYMLEKSRAMIVAGTERVIWVLTQSNASVVFRQTSGGEVRPELITWNEPVEVLPGIFMPIAEWLRAEGEAGLLDA